MNIVVVLPVCKPDFNLACKWLQWVKALQCPPFDLVVFTAASLEDDHVARLRGEIAAIPQAILEVNPNYYERHDLGYAACANSEFRSALEMTERLFPGRPTLWAEPDTTPTRATWAQEIDDEYAACQKPVLGDFHASGAIPHATGNSVYPSNWRQLIPGIALLPYPRPEQGWDSALAHQTVPVMHRSIRIQQIWMTPVFTEQNASMVHPQTALFHRDKTGTLIDVLAARLGLPPIPLEPPIVSPTQIIRTMPNGGGRARRGGTELMIVAYRKDMEFLRYCLRFIEKNATGFTGITLAVPEQEKGLYNWTDNFGVRLHYFNEVEGRGFLCHLIQKCRADQICPEADYICHLDADVMMWRPTKPSDLMGSSGPLMVREKYSLLLNPNRRYWQKCVYNALGFYPEYETMVCHCQVHPAEIYAAMRNAVEQRNGVSFDSYVISGQNKFPQSVAEWPMIGAIAHKLFADRYTFRDYDRNKDAAEMGVSPMGGWQYLYSSSRDHFCELWSHAGAEKYRKDMDDFLAGRLPKYYMK